MKQVSVETSSIILKEYNKQIQKAEREFCLEGKSTMQAAT